MYGSWAEELAAQEEELKKLRAQNLASQGQVSPTPYFGGSSYNPSTAYQGTGRGALSHQNNEIGYYGNGQWNRVGDMPAVGTPQWMQYVQQSSYEGDQQANMQAGVAKLPQPTQSYTHAQPPSWAPRVNTSNPSQSNFLGGQVSQTPKQNLSMGVPQQPSYSAPSMTPPAQAQTNTGYNNNYAELVKKLLMMYLQQKS